MLTPTTARVNIIKFRQKNRRSDFFLLCFEFEMLACFHTTGANLDASTREPCLGLGECNPLEVGVLAGVTTWVKLGRTNTV